MDAIHKVEQPTRRGKRALLSRAPKIIENDKKTLFIHGMKTSPIGRDLLKCFYAFKRANSIYFGRKHQILPFEEAERLERLSKMKDTSLFAYTSHSKKRPNNVVFGRLFNHQILDMVELGVSDWRALDTFCKNKVGADTKPCVLFHGVGFTQSPEYVRLKSLLLDFFRGPQVTNVSPAGFELAIQFTMFEGKIFMRCYKILLKKSGVDVPRVELQEIGPSLTFTLRRSKLASDDLLKTACRKPKALISRPVKNISKNALGTKLGRVHMQRQDYKDLQVRKTAVIKKAKKEQIQKRKIEKNLANAAKAANLTQ